MIKKWVKNLKKKMKWYDFSFIKISMFFSTLFLITAFPAFLEFVMRYEWYWYLMLVIAFAIPVWKKMF